MITGLNILCKKLGYTFSNQQLLEDALSHRSFQPNNNNERLEFLGDSVLNFVIAAALFAKYPEAKEGELSRIRANLVRAETLTQLAYEFELGSYLRLGMGELKSGGSQRTSILADAVEAVIGAIYLDGGMTVCQTCVLTWYATRLADPKQFAVQKDPKTQLQEYSQAHKFPLPVYTIQKIEGAAHQQIFHVECTIAGLPYRAIGIASNRRHAEQDAAQKILESLQHA